ncbi:uncharacterized protein LOC131940963 [Physella acuta]|uniref:uncharacterized protein LOC131940963 n=1 Tax=Physella acuta TaxID=109671 RepID=UPI0027DCAE5C|nr:uncharacterized protein LOC131940963 [Physella acuta]
MLRELLVVCVCTFAGAFAQDFQDQNETLPITYYVRTAGEIVTSVQEILNKAREGIYATELGQRLNAVNQDIHLHIRINGRYSKYNSKLRNYGYSYDYSVLASYLFDDSLNKEAGYLNGALLLLESLVNAESNFEFYRVNQPYYYYDAASANATLHVMTAIIDSITASVSRVVGRVPIASDQSGSSYFNKRFTDEELQKAKRTTAGIPVFNYYGYWLKFDDYIYKWSDNNSM